MADFEALDWLAANFAGSLRPRSVSNPNARPQRVWTLQRQADLAHVLTGVEPYLKVKATQARLMLAYLQAGSPREKLEAGIRMNGMNKRGVART
jgi:hypothetical protein